MPPLLVDGRERGRWSADGCRVCLSSLVGSKILVVAMVSNSDLFRSSMLGKLSILYSILFLALKIVKTSVFGRHGNDWVSRRPRTPLLAWIQPLSATIHSLSRLDLQDNRRRFMRTSESWRSSLTCLRVEAHLRWTPRLVSPHERDRLLVVGRVKSPQRPPG